VGGTLGGVHAEPWERDTDGAVGGEVGVSYPWGAKGVSMPTMLSAQGQNQVRTR
jgi:hypothetical protein